ncbi:MAG: GNAT family N-acetyltransferase [Bacteroidales bacterium]|nr:GNAT family N-acetyltransferase [Bacteroidales bacterium]
MFKIKKINTALDLHNDWDNFTSNYFQTKEFLVHAQKYNPCEQRYYQCFNNREFVGGAVMYSIRLDFLTFLRIKSPLKMNIVGIPASVSAQGIFGEINIVEKLTDYIFDAEKGLVVFLNLYNKPEKKFLATGNTLPTIVLKNTFCSWDDYFAKLRANYRRRLNLIQYTSNIELLEYSCHHFTEQMYEQYLQVFYKSKDKLEKLNFEFFKNLPTNFNLTVCKKQNNVIGWNITAKYKNYFYFFLGGIDYKFNSENSTYLRLLVNIVKQGIEQKVEYIDFGQTAEIPKLRMGGHIEKRYIQAKHSNKFFNKFIKMAEKSLGYNRQIQSFNVFSKNTF